MDSAIKNAKSRSVHMLVWNPFVHDARVTNEAITLIKAGYTVRVHALNLPGMTVETETTADGIEVVRYGKKHALKQNKKESPVGFISARLHLITQVLSRVGVHVQMIWALLRSRPDVIHAHDVNMLPTAWLAAALLRCPLVYDAHEISTGREDYDNLTKFVACIEGTLMPRAKGLITTTNMRAKFFARAYGVKRPLVLQNRPRYQQVQESNKIRRVLELDKPWPIVLYQGGLQVGRGLDLLLQAASETPEAYFVFLGSGSLSEKLKDLSKSLQLDNRVYFIPAVPLAELPAYTASADIGVQPIQNTCINHLTTDSNKLFEYVQAGLPVITTDLPEIRKVVKSYDLGLLVPSNDKKELVKALNTLVCDRALRKHYAGKTAEAAFELNWEEQEKDLLELYANVTR